MKTDTMQRLFFFLLTALFGFLALLTRAEFALPDFVIRYGGDYLWGIMLYFLLCALLPSFVGFKNLALALLVSYSVESLQLYQADWIMAVRANKWGGLLLGHGFLWSDILLYTLGNISGFLMGFAALSIIGNIKAVKPSAARHSSTLKETLCDSTPIPKPLND